MRGVVVEGIVVGVVGGGAVRGVEVVWAMVMGVVLGYVAAAG